MVWPLFHKILILIIKYCAYKVTSSWKGAEHGANNLSRLTFVTVWDLKFSQWWATPQQLKIDTGFKALEWKHGEPSKHRYLYASRAGQWVSCGLDSPWFESWMCPDQLWDQSKPAVSGFQGSFFRCTVARVSGWPLTSI